MARLCASCFTLCGLSTKTKTLRLSRWAYVACYTYTIIWAILCCVFYFMKFDYRTTCQTNRPISITLVKQIEIWTYAIPLVIWKCIYRMRLESIFPILFFLSWFRSFVCVCVHISAHKYFFSRFCSQSLATPKAQWKSTSIRGHNESCWYISFESHLRYMKIKNNHRLSIF